MVASRRLFKVRRVKKNLRFPMLDIRFVIVAQSKRKNKSRAHLVASSERQNKRVNHIDTLLMKRI